MHFFGSWGTLYFIIGLVITAWLIGEKIYKIYYKMPVRDIVDQPLFFLALLSIVIGTQLFLAGFLGELISTGSGKEGDYIVAERSGFDD
jgi:hypothetical protein